MENTIDLSTINQKSLIASNIDSVTLRRNYVKQLVGDINNCGDGIIKIDFSNGHIQTIRTKNLAQRLDNIFYQLMAPRHINCPDVWIRKIKEKRGPFSYEEILDLKIKIEQFGSWISCNSRENDVQ